MSETGRRFRVAARIALVLSFSSPSALAEMTKDQCVDANGEAQDLRRDGKLSAAREKLRLCTNASCPAIVRDDCTRRLDELDRAQPTIAFEVKDASGADVSAVKVTVDGKPLTDRLDGTALRVDIGQHVFTFEIAAQAPVTRTLVMTEGEKGTPRGHRHWHRESSRFGFGASGRTRDCTRADHTPRHGFFGN